MCVCVCVCLGGCGCVLGRSGLSKGSALSLPFNSWLCTLFCACVEYIRGMLKDVKFSDQGSNAREREATYMLFLKYLQRCERSKSFF